MGDESTNEVRLCRNCDELSIWAFDQILKGKGLKHLVYGYDGFGDPEINTTKALTNLKAIKDEAFKLAGSQEALQTLLCKGEVDYLQTRFEVVYILISKIQLGHYKEGNFQKYVSELNRWRYYLDPKKSIDENIEKLWAQHIASKTKINKLKNKLLGLLEEVPEQSSLVREKIKLKQVLSFGDDLKKISVLEWFEINKEAVEIVKSKKYEKPSYGS